MTKPVIISGQDHELVPVTRSQDAMFALNISEPPGNGTDLLPSNGDKSVFLCFVTNVILDGTFSIVGVLCNVLCVIVLQTDKCKMSVTILLQGLACADVLFLIYSFIYTTLRSVYPYMKVLGWIRSQSPYIVANLLPFGWIAQTCTIWMVVCVALDRYIAVCRPFKARKWCTVRNAKWAVVVVWLLSVVFNAPRFFYYHHVAFNNESNINSSLSASKTFIAHMEPRSFVWKQYRIVYHTALSLMFLYIIPLPLLTILNLKLAKAIAGARRRQVALLGTRNERESHAVSLNLVVVVSVFIICQTPDLVATIITLNRFHVDQSVLDVFLCVRESLLVLNASTNFLIYCVFYKRFRKLLTGLLCVHPSRVQAPWEAGDSNSPLQEGRRSGGRLSNGVGTWL